MRILVLAMTALLASASLWLMGRAGAPADTDEEFPIAAAVPQPAVAAEAAGVAPLAEADHGRVESTLLPTSRGRQLKTDVVLRAPAELATAVPTLYSLTSTQARGPKGEAWMRQGGVHGLWRWGRAEHHGTRITGVPSWGSQEDAGPAEIRMQIPQLRRGARVFARLGDLVAASRASFSGRGTVEIDFAAPTEVISSVQVVHADGEPAAGVRVIAVSETLTGGYELSSPGLGLLPVTDASGQVELALPMGSLPAAVVMGLPLVRASPGSRTRIELLSVGSVDVRLPTSRSERVEWLTVTDDSEWSRPYHRGLRFPVENGRALVFPVALGKRYDLGARHLGVIAKRLVDGPQALRETIDVTLDQASAPRLKLRLVDEAGEPLTDGSRYYLTLAQLDNEEIRAQANDEGEIWFSLENLAVGDRLGDAEVRARAYSFGSRGGRAGTTRVDQQVVEGVIDGGTVVMRLPNVLVSGRVIDGAGQL